MPVQKKKAGAPVRKAAGLRPSASQPEAEDAPSPKLAEQVAEKVERDVIGRGWNVGEILGSEAELAERYGTSRWVMREVIGIGERDGLLEIRRGRGGGIAVAAPALEAVGSTIRNYLGVCRVSAQHLAESRMLLETLGVSLAAERLDDAIITRLRTAASDARDVSEANSLETSYRLLRELLGATGNVALPVFAYALSQLTADMALRAGVPERTLRKASIELVDYRVQLVDAIIGYDLPRASRLLSALLDRATGLVSRRSRGRANPELLELPKSIVGLDGTPRGKLKRTEQLTYHLQAEIIANDWPVGRHLGSEAELMTRYDVSRSVLREAIRPLERMGLVEMRRGRNSGLKVSNPQPRTVVRSAVLYLNHARLSQADAYAVQQVLETTAASSVASLPPESRGTTVESLARVIDTRRAPNADGYEQAIHDFYIGLARAAPNPIVSLFICILTGTMSLDRAHLPKDRSMAELIREVQERQRALVKAIAAGDEALARRRMMELRASILPIGARQRAPEQLIG